jgi:restriction system protein
LILGATANYQNTEVAFSQNMTPVEYEQFVAKILRDFGWSARLTAATGDQGIDVIAEKKSIKVVIQCKLYSKPVGNAAVQEAIAGKSFERANFAAVVTNAGFTTSAKQLATSSGVILLHHGQLGNLATACGIC